VPFSVITYSSVSPPCLLITIKMPDQLILPSTPAAGVRVLALNRPSKRNALSQDLITVFLEHLHSASNDDGVRVIVITGSTTFFCGMNSPSPLYRQGQGAPGTCNPDQLTLPQQPELISGRSHGSMRKGRGSAAISRTFVRGCKPCASL